MSDQRAVADGFSNRGQADAGEGAAFPEKTLTTDAGSIAILTGKITAVDGEHMSVTTLVAGEAR